MEIPLFPTSIHDYRQIFEKRGTFGKYHPFLPLPGVKIGTVGEYAIVSERTLGFGVSAAHPRPTKICVPTPVYP